MPDWVTIIQKLVMAVPPKLLPLLLLLVLPTYAQTPASEPNTSSSASVPTIKFEFELPGAQPAHYSVLLESSGQAAYHSEATPQPGAPVGEPYALKFVVSEFTRTRIFDLARQANYFDGDFDYTKSRIANMGAKTLSYRDDRRDHQTQYNYSVDPVIQQLTKFFQDLSTTLEYSRQLAYLYHYDKLGLESELKSMEGAEKDGWLAELQVAEPILNQIAADHSVMNISRRRAERLLDKIRTTASLSATPPAARQ